MKTLYQNLTALLNTDPAAAYAPATRQYFFRYVR